MIKEKLIKELSYKQLKQLCTKYNLKIGKKQDMLDSITLILKKIPKEVLVNLKNEVSIGGSTGTDNGNGTILQKYKGIRIPGQPLYRPPYRSKFDEIINKITININEKERERASSLFSLINLT